MTKLSRARLAVACLLAVAGFAHAQGHGVIASKLVELVARQKEVLIDAFIAPGIGEIARGPAGREFDNRTGFRIEADAHLVVR